CDHRGGALLVVGGAGTGKTTTLVARSAELAGEVARGATGGVLVLAPTRVAAELLRARIDDELGQPAEVVAVTTAAELCARLLREHALELGLDPFALPVARGDRLALLLDRTDELE